jgi:hypothetical protein
MSYDILTEALASVVTCISKADLTKKQLESLTIMTAAVSAALSSKISSHVSDPQTSLTQKTSKQKPIATTNSTTGSTTNSPTVLTLVQYRFLQAMYSKATSNKKGAKSTNLQELSQKLTSQPDYKLILAPLREFFRKNNTGIVINKTNHENIYMLRLTDLDKVRSVLSDTIYSSYPGYMNYQPAPNVTEIDIINAVKVSKNRNQVLRKCGLKSSGGTYDMVNKVIDKHKLKLGSEILIQNELFS